VPKAGDALKLSLMEQMKMMEEQQAKEEQHSKKLIEWNHRHTELQGKFLKKTATYLELKELLEMVHEVGRIIY